jgi:hypothetical protein
MNRNVSGFYHDPPVFLGEHPIDHAGKGGTFGVFFDRFDKEVLRTNLAGGLALRATVEGMFAFDFSAMTDYASSDAPDLPDDLDEMAEKIIRRTRVMNAYLAFFYTQQLQIDKLSGRRMVITPELIISMDKMEENSSQGYGNQRVSHLATSRFEATYSSKVPPLFDSRINMRGLPISVEVVQAAAVDLSDLVERHGDDGIMLVDLYLRASKAFQDHNHSLSVIDYWTVVERMVNELWDAMIKDESITGQRRERLEDSRTFTAAVMIEILALLKRIATDLYEDITKVRQARNRWMHTLKTVTAEDAILANTVCERLLEQVKGLTLKGSTGRWLHG